MTDGLFEKHIVIDPMNETRNVKLPPLSMIVANTVDRRAVVKIKRETKRPVIVAFPAKGDEELLTLEREIELVQPLVGNLVDQIWVSFGGDEEDEIPFMCEKRGVRVYYTKKHRMSDVGPDDRGKGHSMRGFVHWLVTQEGIRDPNAIIEFLDADIQEGFFSPRWVTDPVGSILWFHEIDVAKVVYYRPHGGRVNAFVKPFLSIFNHPALNPLKKILYVLSGEMAGTLRFWLGVPFKQSFGIEARILTALAFNRFRLRPEGNDLDRVIQVFVGKMDHRHTALMTTRSGRGLDAMAKEVFQTFLEAFYEEGLLTMGKGLAFSDLLELTTVEVEQVGDEETATPVRISLPARERQYAPLRDVPEIRQVMEK